MTMRFNARSALAPPLREEIGQGSPAPFKCACEAIMPKEQVRVIGYAVDNQGLPLPAG